MRALYAAAAAAVFAGLAVFRRDLVLQAWQASAHQFSLGGAPRAKLAAEILLLGGIFAFVLKTIPSRAKPKKDALTVIIAGALGFLVEAWGTRTGLWSYYTGERPPLWIIPAWSLGALVLDRVARALEERFSRRIPETALAALSDALLLFFALFGGAFAAACGAGPMHWLLPACLALGLRWARAPLDAWVLAGGLPCVFFADLWGTTNLCWTYRCAQGHSSAGTGMGILFGMLLDSCVVLASLKLAGTLDAIGGAGPTKT
ncbi:MAG: hypothetical protein WCU88_12215 [Elusimicrobiota bacterium]|jgi:hypothetical protein